MRKELYKKHRPKDFDGIIGQDNAVKTLQRMVQRNQVAHTILFTGPSGCGKTTLARIMRRKLHCGKQDFNEINCADFRGIDMVREIRTRMMLAPINGKCRIWLIDECFAKGTFIKTPNGDKKIEELKIGDSVFSAFGKDKIVNTFVNRIPFKRLIKLRFANGKSLYCSDKHEFYTDRGWIFSKNLTKKDLIFSFVSNIMQENKLLMKGKYNGQMPKLQKENAKINSGEKDSDILQQVLCHSKSLPKGNEILPSVQNPNNLLPKSSEKIQQEILQQKLSSNRQIKKTGISEKILQHNYQRKNTTEKNRILSNNKRKKRSTKIFDTNEIKQSDAPLQNHQENDKYQKEKRDASHLVGKTRRQWVQNKTTKIIGPNSRSFNGVCNKNSKSKTSFQKRSILLQSRFSNPQEKNSNRSRWKQSQNKISKIYRPQKNKHITFTRLESIEIYKRGSNEQSFESIIKNRELQRNYIELYDLEIKNHPSYFANGILVHNCHKLSNDAQNAFLKMLEDTPSHIYFFLVTTEPQKLIKTIRTRSTEIPLKPLISSSLEKLVKQIAEIEKLKIPDEVIDKITSNSDGSARKALVFLNQIMRIESEEEMLDAINPSVSETKAVNIAQALFNPRTKWIDMVRLLKDLEGEEPENLRLMVLGYARKVILSAGKQSSRAFAIIEAFRDNFWDSKMAGFVAACAEVIGMQK